jgi:hypothetical protein
MLGRAFMEATSMEPMRRENRVLRVAVVLLSCVVVGGVATSDGQQGQRFPGPGTGVVDVQLVREAEVAAAQRGPWNVGQQGEWRVGVIGSVATLPAMPPVVKRGGTYAVRGPGLEASPWTVTVRELHPSGWARIDDEAHQEHWINLAAMSSIRER